MNIRDLLLQEIEQEQPQAIFDAPIVDNVPVNNNAPVKSWLGDLARGYNDNYKNRWGYSDLPKEKNFTTRLGEGLGSVGRFIDSPLGRGLIAGGLNSALGYDNSLQEGLNAYVGRQNAQTADRVYRKQLGQMGYTDQDLANITGDITPSIYKGLTDSFRLGNQRMTYGQLAMFDDDIAEMLRQSPELSNQFVPLTFARDIYTKRKQKAEADIEGTQARTEKTKADTEGSRARTEKTKAETGQVGKPKVTKTIKEGHVTVDYNYNGGSGGKGGNKGGNKPTQPNRPVGASNKNNIVSKLKSAGYSDSQIQQYLKAKGIK